MPARMSSGRGPQGLLLLVSLPLAVACGAGAPPVADTGQEAPVETERARTSGEAGEPVPPESAAEAKAEITEPVIHEDGSVTYPHGETIKPLTSEEEELLEKDPEGLTKDERRQQAYLRRRKILLDPDSDSAKHIVETITAIESGELDAPVPPPPAAPAPSEPAEPTK